MPKYLKAVIYEIESHGSGGQFSVTQEALKCLDIVNGYVHLIVENAETGEHYFEGDKPMKSGTEIYGEDVNHIPANTLLRITVSPVE